MVTEATKEQLILAIQSLNHSASYEFLSQFGEHDLREYLSSLQATVRTVREESPAGSRLAVSAN